MNYKKKILQVIIKSMNNIKNYIYYLIKQSDFIKINIS